MRNYEHWYGAEWRHLAALRAVAREGSFGRAAVALGYTQSAISQQIAALERIVGRRLVERPGTGRRAALTPAGEVVLRHAESILARLGEASAELRALDGDAPALLRVGVLHGLAARVLPVLVHRFRLDHPGGELELVEDAGDQTLLELLGEGALDLAFAALPLDESRFAGVRLFDDPYVLVVSADAPLAKRGGPIALDEVVGLTLVGFHGCAAARRLETRLRAAGLTPKISLRADDAATVQSLVAAGFGAALLPRLAFDDADGRLAAIDVAGLEPRVLGLARREGFPLSPLAASFLARAESLARGLRPPSRAGLPLRVAREAVVR